MVLLTFTNISTSCVTRLWIPTSFPWWVVPEEDPLGHSRQSLLQSICVSDSSTNQRGRAHHYPTTTDWCTEWHQGPTRFVHHPAHFCIHEFNVFPLDYWQVEKNNGLRQEYDVITTPPAAQSTRVQSAQPFNTPDASQRRDLPTQLTYDSPVSRAPPGASSGLFEWRTIRLKVISFGHNVWWMFWSKAPAAAAAVESGAEGRGAPLTSVQMNFVRNMIHEALEDFRWVSTYLL